MSERGYHHGDLRAALLGAAMAMLDEEGPTAVNLREAARRVGVSATAPYRHFRDKEALLTAVATQGFQDLSVRLAAAAGGPEPRLNRMGEAYVRFALERPGRFRLMFGQAAQSLGRDPRLAEAARAAFASLGRATATEVADPLQGTVPARIDAVKAWALVHGLAFLLLDGMLPRAEADQWLAAVFPQSALEPPTPVRPASRL